MKTKHSNLNLPLCAILALGCGLTTWGCSPRKTVTRIDKNTTLQVDNPTVETVPQDQDSIDPATIDPATVVAPETIAKVAVDPPQSPAASIEPEVPDEPPQTWSTHRILALASIGPLVIDVSANIGGKSLDEAAAAATGRVVAQIAKDLDKPWTWAKLLDHPLISSGWLGNLVPEGEQRGQLIGMYNKDGDDEADDDELPAFLTRGLARQTAFRFTDIGFAPGTTASRSPWEQLDINRDSSLDKSEIANLPTVIARFDLNADHTITIAEMQSNRSTQSTEMMGSSSMLDSKSALEVGPDQKPQQVARKLLEHYTVLGSISREQWPGWSDTKWNAFDVDGDQQITSKELERITTVKPDLDVRTRFQINAEAGGAMSATVGTESELIWTSRLKTAGQASNNSAALAVGVTDSYTAANRASLRAQLASALSNPQVATFLRNQLKLSEGAFEVLDADNDEKLSDEEFDNAWEWLTAIRGSRILARWMLAESAWFRMADADADGRLTEIELKKFASFLAGLDYDKDGSISPFEMPLAVRLEIARTDDRMTVSFTPSQSDTPPVEVGWFAASDSNNDGVISKAEFLGSSEDFLAYDTDNDGFISATEAYKSPTSSLQ